MEEEIFASNSSMDGMLRRTRGIVSVMTSLQPFKDVFRRKLAGSLVHQ